MNAEHLLENNMGLVGYVMAKYIGKSITRANPLIDKDDLFQIGSLGLWKAANSWDEAKGCAFSTYAVTCIRNELMSEFRKQQNSGEFEFVSCSIDDAPPVAANNYPEEGLYASSVIEDALKVFGDGKKEGVKNLLGTIAMGYGVSEAARMVGLREGQARSIIRRIRYAAN